MFLLILFLSMCSGECAARSLLAFLLTFLEFLAYLGAYHKTNKETLGKRRQTPLLPMQGVGELIRWAVAPFQETVTLVDCGFCFTT